MKACILTHWEVYEDRTVYGVFLSKEAGEAFIQRCRDAENELQKSFPKFPEGATPDADVDAWYPVHVKIMELRREAKWPGGLDFPYDLPDLELDEVEILG